MASKLDRGSGQPGISQPGLFGTHSRRRSRLVISVLLALLSLGPLLYMVSLSFQNNGDIREHSSRPHPPNDEQLYPGMDREQFRALLPQ